MSDSDALPNSDSDIQGTIVEFDDPVELFDSTVISAKSPIAFAVGLTSWRLGKAFRASCCYQTYDKGCFSIQLCPSDSKDNRCEIVSRTKNYSDASQAVAMLTELYNLQVKISKNESEWATFYQHLEKTNAFLRDTQCHKSSE